MVRLNALIAAFVLLIAASAMRAGAAPVAARATSIQGNAWTAENAPIPRARLRLRNVTSGKIEGTAIANEAGQFTFSNMEPGTYLVELVSEVVRLPAQVDAGRGRELGGHRSRGVVPGPCEASVNSRNSPLTR